VCDPISPKGVWGTYSKTDDHPKSFLHRVL